ncbi:MAG: ABC exporter membrane fusion protein [Cyanobacteria bacterium J06649_5]
MNVLGMLSSQGDAAAAPDGQANGQSSSQLKSKPWRVSQRWITLAGILLLGLVGFSVWRSHQTRVAEQAAAAELAAQPPKITTVTALGRLEPQGELINLTAPTAVQSARIDELPVSVGDRVAANQVIAILDNRDRLQAALAKAEQQVNIARAQLAKVEAGSQTGEIEAQRAEILRLEAELLGNVETQEATIARIRAEVNNARTDFERYNTLYERGGISASDRDARRLTLTTTEQRLAEAKATLSRLQRTNQQQISQAKATLDRIQEVRPVDVDAARADVNSAIASVEEARANLDQAYVRSPAAGQIIEIHTYPGETISSDGIATVGQTQQMMAIAEVYQDDITKIKPGQPVTLTSSVFDDTLQGTVQRMGLQIDQQQVVNEDPTANIDARVVEVYIRLDAEDSEKVAGLTNLQVTATIQLE